MVVSDPPDVVEVVEESGLVVVVVVVVDVADAGAVADVVEEVEELVEVVDVVVSAAACSGMAMATTRGATIREAIATLHTGSNWNQPLCRPMSR
jgi:NAD(P)-dependent dehydrogenase (short-subunit alcohol dehydrogenase family)